MKKLSLGLLSLVAAISLVGCGNSGEEKTTLKVGATAVPHAEILEQAKPLLKEKGIELDVVTFQDYVLPNTTLDEGELDANYFQHIPYLEGFNTVYEQNEGDAVLINTNYALDGGLNPMTDSIAMEGSESPYVNIIAVNSGDENRDDIKTLVEVLRSKEIQDFIVETYAGAVVPVSE